MQFCSGAGQPVRPICRTGQSLILPSVNLEDQDLTGLPEVIIRSQRDPDVSVRLLHCQFVDEDG
jgi:hypothetical protein